MTERGEDYSLRCDRAMKTPPNVRSTVCNVASTSYFCHNQRRDKPDHHLVQLNQQQPSAGGMDDISRSNLVFALNSIPLIKPSRALHGCVGIFYGDHSNQT